MTNEEHGKDSDNSNEPNNCNPNGLPRLSQIGLDAQHYVKHGKTNIP